MIAEDDTFYDEKMSEEIRRTFKTIPQNADFAVFLYIPSLSSFKNCGEIWCEIEPRSFRGTQLYYLTPKAARILLNTALPLVMQVDGYLSYVIGTDNDLKGYAWNRNPYSLKNTFNDPTSAIVHNFHFKRFMPNSDWPYIIFIILLLSLIIFSLVCGFKKYPKKKCKKGK